MLWKCTSKRLWKAHEGVTVVGISCGDSPADSQRLESSRNPSVLADIENFAYFRLLSSPQATRGRPVEEHIFQAQSLGREVFSCSSAFHAAFIINCFNPKEEKKEKKISDVLEYNENKK